MFFVYLKDGRRVDIPDAASVVHRSMVLFLDDGDNIVEQFATKDIVAYTRMPYWDQSRGRNAAGSEGAEAEGDLVMLRRHRRRRAAAPRESSPTTRREAPAARQGCPESSLG